MGTVDYDLREELMALKGELEAKAHNGDSSGIYYECVFKIEEILERKARLRGVIAGSKQHLELIKANWETHHTDGKVIFLKRREL